jgi:hypothetical protein
MPKDDGYQFYGESFKWLFIGMLWIFLILGLSLLSRISAIEVPFSECAKNIVLGFSYSMISATKSANMCKAKFDSSSIEEQWYLDVACFHIWCSISACFTSFMLLAHCHCLCPIITCSIICCSLFLCNGSTISSNQFTLSSFSLLPLCYCDICLTIYLSNS